MPPDIQTPTEAELWTAVAKERADGTAPVTPEASTPSTPTEPTQVAAPTTVATPEVPAVGATVDPTELRIQELMAAQLQLSQQTQHLAQQLSTATGRIGSLQSELARAKAAPVAAAPVAPTSTAVNDALASPDKWKALKSEFPEWAEATEALVQANRSVQAAPAAPAQPAVDVASMQQTIKDQLRQELEQATLQTVEAAHPGWLQTVATPAFAAWRDAQPPEVVALGSSPHAADAIHMLSLFKATVGSADQVSQQRSAVLQAGAHARPAAPTARLPKAAATEPTPEELWAQEAKRRQEERAKQAA